MVWWILCMYYKDKIQRHALQILSDTFLRHLKCTYHSSCEGIDLAISIALYLG